jgi:diguanylate cyclase (GGDEF)-like protein
MPGLRSIWYPAARRWPLITASVFLALVLIVASKLYLSHVDLRKAADAYLLADGNRRSSEIEDFLKERKTAAARIANSHTINAYLVNLALGMSRKYGLDANLDYINLELSRELRENKLRGRAIYREIIFIYEDGEVLARAGDNSRVSALPEIKPEVTTISVDHDTRTVFAIAPVRHKGLIRGRVITATDLDLLSALLISSTDEDMSINHAEYLFSFEGKNVVAPDAAPKLIPREIESIAHAPLSYPSVIGNFTHPTLSGHFVTIRSPVNAYPVTLVSLTREQQAYGNAGSSYWVLLIVVTSFALFAAAVGFERQRFRASRLQSDVEESNRHRVELAAKNGELLAEIARREAVEATVVAKSAQINKLAYYDQLTGLPNRALLTERANQFLANNDLEGVQGALFFVDLDHFKTLNDTLGHDYGDQLLKLTAERLLACVDHTATVARFGGDEFVIFAPRAYDEASVDAAMAAKTIAEKMIAKFERPFDLFGFQFQCSPSIGIVLFSPSVDNFDDLWKRADLAMYEAKASGRNSACIFEPRMQDVTIQRAKLEAELRADVSRHSFELLYQPQVDVSGRLIGAEALIRWPNQTFGFVSPAKFIPIAEATSLIIPMGHWVLEQACQQLKAWSASPVSNALTIAVNVSGVQLKHEGFVDSVLEVIDRYGIDPNILKLELTESVFIDSIEEIIGKMIKLRRKGVRFSLDDFGTGFSSLSYLKRLPLDQLKIDQGFVRDILTDQNDAAIAQMIVALGRTIGLSVIAEGVEDEEQRQILTRMGCNAFQGYLFGRPMAADALMSNPNCFVASSGHSLATASVAVA